MACNVTNAAVILLDDIYLGFKVHCIWYQTVQVSNSLTPGTRGHRSLNWRKVLARFVTVVIVF